jgi:hypothetical protein
MVRMSGHGAFVSPVFLAREAALLLHVLQCLTSAACCWPYHKSAAPVLVHGEMSAAVVDISVLANFE